jgi:hypothetical protein
MSESKNKSDATPPSSPPNKHHMTKNGLTIKNPSHQRKDTYTKEKSTDEKFVEVNVTDSACESLAIPGEDQVDLLSRRSGETVSSRTKKHKERTKLKGASQRTCKDQDKRQEVDAETQSGCFRGWCSRKKRSNNTDD